jgi:uncharacterized membrane protein YjjP (DUF1212 family)
MVQRETEKLFGVILDIGVAMIQSGADTHSVEVSLYCLCRSYGFIRNDIWVVPSNIQGTVTAPDGAVITQIRHVRDAGIDFYKLERLNALSRRACVELPDSVTLHSALTEANSVGEEHSARRFLAAALAAAGFGVFFHCNPADALVAVLVSAVIVLMSERLRQRENNPLILNFLISAAAEAIILLCTKLGIGHHSDYITVGVIMLLISALGTTNGVRDLVHLDTLSGLVNISSSLTGAIGIALGTALPLLLTQVNSGIDPSPLNPSLVLQLIGCTVGCTGFALWLHVRREYILFCALGAPLTWISYILLSDHLGLFPSVLLSAAVCGLYAQILARIHNCPATVFQTISVFPLIPGSALYYMMYGAVIGDMSLAIDRGLTLLLICFGIVLGFMVVEACISFSPTRK